MKKNKTQLIVLTAMLVAIEVAMVFIPFLGFIPIGPLRATTLHIPVIIAGIIIGKEYGALLGLVFGLCSMLNSTINVTPTSFVFSPFISGQIISLFIAIIPRILIGYLAGLIYELLSKRIENTSITIMISTLCGALANPILVLGSIALFFSKSYALAIGIKVSTLNNVLLTIISTQSLLETILALIIVLPVCKAIFKYQRRSK